MGSFWDHLSSMCAGIEVRSTDPVLRRVLQGWLEDGRITPPAPLWLEVEVGQPPPVPESIPVIFRQPGIAVRRLPGDQRLSIRWETVPAAAELLPGEAGARVTLSPAAVDLMEEGLRTFLLVVLIFLLRRAGWHHVHGGTAVDPQGRGWLFAGDSRSGKSTTTALVGRNGWGIGGDDITFLLRAGERVAARSFRTRIALRPGGQDLLAAAGGVALPARGKVGYWPEELGGVWVPSLEPVIIAFTSVAGDRTEVVALRPGDGLARLVRWSAWVVVEPELAGSHLDLLNRLGKQSRAYHVSLGRDVFRNPDLLLELIR